MYTKLTWFRFCHNHSQIIIKPLGCGLIPLLAIILQLAILGRTAPVITQGTQVCSDVWFHGYQSLGITFTVGDSNSKSFVIGGSVPSGCSTLDPAQTFLNDQCAIVQYFGTYSAAKPTATQILATFPYAGLKLGITGLVAMTKSKQQSTESAIGVVQIGSGASYSTNPTSFTPDGTELAIFDLAVGQNYLRYYYINGYFQGYNCGISKSTQDRYNGAQILTLAFQQCMSPQDNYVVQLQKQSDTVMNVKSFTKFPQASLLKWYQVTNDGNGDGFLLTGLAQIGTEKALRWLVTQTAGSSTDVSAPKCDYNLMFNTDWQSTVGGDLIPAFTSWANFGPRNYEGVVALHNPGFYSGFALLLNWDKVCTSNFDVLYAKDASWGTVTVLDMQLFYNQADEGSEVKVLVQAKTQIWIVKNIVNEEKKGWKFNKNNPNTQLLIIQRLSSGGATPNPLFQFSLADVDLSSAFMFEDSSAQPVFFGKSNKYWQGVDDGFMWRYSSQSCIEYKLSISAGSPFSSFNSRFCAYRPSNPQDHYMGGDASCDAQFNSIQVPIGGNVLAPMPSANLQTLTITGWTQSDKYSVKNPCMLAAKASTTSQTVQLGAATTSPALSPIIQYNCPYSLISLSTLKLDYTLVSVQNNAAPPATSTLIANYVAPVYTPSPYSYSYKINQITDISLVGTWTATFKFFIQGDSNSVVYLDTTTNQNTATITINGCTPTKTFPITLPPQTLNIGTPLTIPLDTQWQNGDCAYSSQPDTGSIWPSVSVYTKEVLLLTGTVKVQSTTTTASIVIDTSDQNLEGTYTYTFKYTDYKSVVHNIPMSVNFVSTLCKPGATGLEGIAGTLYQSILSTSAISIDISTVRNNECGYSVEIQQLSGPRTASFMASVTQPIFTGSTTVRVFNTPGTVQVNALSGTIPQKQAEVGTYTFQLIVKDELTPFTSRGTATFTVEIQNCANEWNPSLNLTQVDYYLSQTKTIDIPSFVDISNFVCNEVTTTFSAVSGIDFGTAITLQQNSTVLGTGQLTIQTTDPTLRNTYTLKITSAEASGAFKSFYMNLTIKHQCDDTIVIPFSFFEKTVTVSSTNSTSSKVQIPLFTQTISDCDPLVYSVSYKLLSGPPSTDLISVDLSTLLLTVSGQSAILKASSTVSVTVTGQVQGLSYLPSKEASFKLTIAPEVLLPYHATVKTQNKTTAETTNKTAPVSNFTSNFTANFTTKHRDETPLVPQILSISSTGEVKIKFNRNIITPSFYANVTMRRKEPDYVETIDQFINLRVKSGIDNLNSNRTQIMMFNLTDFQKNTITLQVDFLNPDQLSSSYTQPDILFVNFFNGQVFVSETQVILLNDTEIGRPIPAQLNQHQAATVAQLTSTVSSGMNTIATVNLVINIVLSFGLKYLWNFVNLLQFLVFIPRWKLNIPLNALAVLQQLKAIALMEFIPTKQITSTISGWFSMDPDDDSNIFNGMGLMLLIALLILVLVVALSVISYFVRNNYSTYKTYRGIRETIFYNAFLRYMLQSVLKVGIASSTTLAAISWRPFATSSITSVATSSLILLVMGLGPLVFALILKKNFSKLPRPSMKKAIGTLYLSIKDTDKVALAYAPIFMLRRLLFIAITFGMAEYPGLQIHLFSYLNLFYVMYLGLVGPHDVFSMTTQELVNESLLMLICYHFILFSGVVQDQDLRNYLGWSLTALIGILLIFNVTVILKANLNELRRKFTLCQLRRKAQAAQNAKVDKLFIQTQSKTSQPSTVSSSKTKATIPIKQKRNVTFSSNIVSQIVPTPNQRVNQRNEVLEIEDFSFRQIEPTFTVPTQQQELVVRQKAQPASIQQRQIQRDNDDWVQQRLNQLIAQQVPERQFQSVQVDNPLFGAPEGYENYQQNRTHFQMDNQGRQWPQQQVNSRSYSPVQQQNHQREYEEAQRKFREVMVQRMRQIDHIFDLNCQQNDAQRFL